MEDNVVLVAFAEQSKAYLALSELRRAGDAGRVEFRGPRCWSGDPTAPCACPKASTPPPARLGAVDAALFTPQDL